MQDVTQSAPQPSRWASIDWSDVIMPAVCIAAVYLGPVYGVTLLVTALVAGGLERVLPYRKVATFTPGWSVDLYHFIVSSFIAGALGGLAMVVVGTPLREALSGVTAPLRVQPLPLQVVEAFLVTDFSIYAFHRAEHRTSWLWRFHQVHHSQENLNWLQSYRVHPIDKAMSSLAALLPLYVLGLWNWALAALIFGTIDAVNTPWAHGNLRVSLGRFWWIVRNPEFHRWHHESSQRGMNSNFAQLFPIWDVLFKTSYMPKDRQPRKFGLPYAFPTDYVDQILAPFEPLKVATAEVVTEG